MPWYLVYAHHGPGHAMSTSLTIWSETVLNTAEKNDLWADTFNIYGCFDQPRGKVYELDGLTANLKVTKTIEGRNKIIRAENILNVLNNTITIGHFIIDKEYKLCSCGNKIYICARCNKEICWHFSAQYGWCPACQKCGERTHAWSKTAPITCLECNIEHPFEKNWAIHR